MINFGKRVSEKRKQIGLTQKELGDICNITEGYISKIENQDCLPSGEIIISLSKALNITSDYLLGLSTEKSNKNSTEEPTEKSTGRIIIEGLTEEHMEYAKKLAQFEGIDTITIKFTYSE